MTVSAIQQELFEQLEAFNPRWRREYDTTEDAAEAAGVHDLWRQWCIELANKAASCDRAPDILAQTKKMQDMQRRSALPFKLNSIGSVKTHSQYRED